MLVFCCFFFCLARKDFNANLHPYLTLAVKLERRQGTGQLLLHWGWVRLPAGERERGAQTLLLRGLRRVQQCGVRCGAGRGLQHHGAVSGTAVSPVSPALVSV